MILYWFSSGDPHPNDQYGRASDGGPGKQGDTTVDIAVKKAKGILKNGDKSSENGHTVTFVTAKEMLLKGAGKDGEKKDGPSGGHKKSKKRKSKARGKKKKKGPRNGFEYFVNY